MALTGRSKLIDLIARSAARIYVDCPRKRVLEREKISLQPATPLIMPDEEEDSGHMFVLNNDPYAGPI